MKVADNLVGTRGNGTLLNQYFFLTIMRSDFINLVLSYSPCVSDLYEVPSYIPRHTSHKGLAK